MTSATNLHDAILESISIDWEQGSATLSLGTSASDKVLSITGLRSLACPRAMPWGPSIYINETSYNQAVDGTFALEIEMQSGDTIGIQAQTFSLTEKNGN
jgi:hypothetical protein